MKEKGFTLIELLLVLTIITTLLHLIVPLQFSSLAKQSERQFIEQLHSDVLLVQSERHFVDRDSLRLRLYSDHYVISRSLSGNFATRIYPEGWRYTGDAANASITFTRSGTILQPRTISFQTNDGKIKFIFPFGKGRFYVDESERVQSH